MLKIGFRGFTLIELMVTLVIAILVLINGVPTLSTWMANARVQSVAEQLQGVVRLAQTEAMRRGRQTAVVLTNAAPAPGATPAAPATNGKNIYVQALPLLDGETVSTTEAFVHGVVLSSDQKATITGPSVICFNTLGRLATNNAPGLDATNTHKCTGTSTQTYSISDSTATRSLRLTVATNGRIRMCDPAKTLSTSVPDGC